MAELAFGIAETVLEKLASKAYEEISLAKSVKNDLKKLEETVLILKSKLMDAEMKQKQNEELRIWVVKLKDLLNDAVDVLDEFDCEALRRQVVKKFGSVGRKVRRFCSASNPLAFRFRIAHRVKGIKERFDEIAEDMARFQLISSQLNGHEEQSHLSVSDRMTHSFVKASEVIGRDCDKAKIIDLLISQDCCDGDSNLSLIPIVGLGGLGKTTLAKSVFNDENVQGMFDLKLWVCVSLDFDVTRLLREVLKSAQYTEQDPSNLSLNQLQNCVRTILKDRKFVLVLDDVWNEDRVTWLELRQFLTGGAAGSKVIVTTRSTIVSSIMTQARPHKLRGLSEKDSLSLFFSCSFGNGKLAEQNQRLVEIGKVIVKKCGGLPLALKTLGSLLYSKPEAKWISVRDSEIWEMEQEDDRILAALRLSYYALPSCMKQCFAYCSLFLEDEYIFDLELTFILMAIGIFQSPNDKLELEEVGVLQVKELCHRSFLECTSDEGDVEKYGTLYGLANSYQMHDLIRDLACSITKSECCIVKSGKEDISSTVRYMRLFSNQFDEAIVQRSKKLWSIHIESNAEEKNISESFISTCIKQLRYLRLFDLRNLSFGGLPSSIGTLKHLRYLDLSENSKIKRLPNSICELQSLQTLLLDKCEELEELPRGMRNLVSLRTLSITTKQTYFPERGIGCLKSLRLLVVEACKNLKSLPSDMSCCSTLRHLFIFNCEQLDLTTSKVDVVIQLSLQTFAIKELPQTKGLPHWLKGASHTLKVLCIENCKSFIALPECLPDSTSLEKLVIKCCPEILTLPNGTACPTSLTHLVIAECKQLELESKDDKLVQLNLKEFKIAGLPRTAALPSWLQGASQTLQVLEIRDCEFIEALPEWLHKMVSLQELLIWGCNSLLARPEEMLNMISLQKLEIRDCNSLSALPEGLQCLVSLTDLIIASCNRLEFPCKSYQGDQLSLKGILFWLERMTSLPEWLQGASHTLERLMIMRCPNLSALPEWLPDLTSLKSLRISRCPKLSTLPEGMSRLTSLTNLTIKKCSSAFQERYEPKIGVDWESISHVPNVRIESLLNEPITTSES